MSLRTCRLDFSTCQTRNLYFGRVGAPKLPLFKKKWRCSFACYIEICKESVTSWSQKSSLTQVGNPEKPLLSLQICENSAIWCYIVCILFAYICGCKLLRVFLKKITAWQFTSTVLGMTRIDFANLNYFIFRTAFTVQTSILDYTAWNSTTINKNILDLRNWSSTKGCLYIYIHYTNDISLDIYVYIIYACIIIYVSFVWNLCFFLKTSPPKPTKLDLGRPRSHLPRLAMTKTKNGEKMDPYFNWAMKKNLVGWVI